VVGYRPQLARSGSGFVSALVLPRGNAADSRHLVAMVKEQMLKQELESRMKGADLQWEWAEVIRGLDNLQQVEANFQGRRFLFRSQLTAHASQALRATGVALPPSLREIQ
jgi:hypothetical protein